MDPLLVSLEKLDVDPCTESNDSTVSPWWLCYYKVKTLQCKSWRELIERFKKDRKTTKTGENVRKFFARV